MTLYSRVHDSTRLGRTSLPYNSYTTDNNNNNNNNDNNNNNNNNNGKESLDPKF